MPQGSQHHPCSKSIQLVPAQKPQVTAVRRVSAAAPRSPRPPSTRVRRCACTPASPQRVRPHTLASDSA
eukprot:5232797-Pleurochrysis_carterae.AAC.3